MLSDGEIANAADLWPIKDVARVKLGIESAADVLIPYGHDKAKIDLTYIRSLADRPDGKLVLVTAVSPTPAGEGKTTTTVGLNDALRRIGKNSMAALREPSMGPVFGMKGGAAGGGHAQVVPMTDINLHFTGDFAAIAAANNLLAALIDNHVHQGNALGIDSRAIVWKRVVDINDRALREVVVGLGGTLNGFPRSDGFDIVVASELMAIFCLADSLVDLRERIGRIVVAYTLDKRPVLASDLGAEGPLTILLKDALAPNLVQSLEHSPVLIHGGPFANIAHGCNSLMATRTALKLADIVVTEAGFGSDLGAEKFFDLKCRMAGLEPSAVVVVATVRALKYHGGVARADLNKEDLDALCRGAANLERHLTNLRGVFGLPAIVAVNRFPTDTDAEVDMIAELVEPLGFRSIPATHFTDGGAGATDLARAVVDAIDAKGPSTFRFAYDLEDSIIEKAEKVARSVYGADGVRFSTRARRDLARIEADGFGRLPICIAKTQYSFSTDPKSLGAPLGHVLDVREVRLSAGAGFAVLITGDVMTMPGLPKDPASSRMTIDEDGTITGLS